MIKETRGTYVFEFFRKSHSIMTGTLLADQSVTTVRPVTNESVKHNIEYRSVAREDRAMSDWTLNRLRRRRFHGKWRFRELWSLRPS